MNPEAFENLLRVLENIPEDQFDLGDWECGTKACAIGWAARDAWFWDQEFYLTGSIPKLRSLCGWEAVRALFHISDNNAKYLFEKCSYEEDQSLSAVISRIKDFIS